MKLVSSALHGIAPTGERVMEVVLLSDDTPSTLPKNGKDISGLSATDVFAPMSLLYVANTSDVYIANESGEFVKQ